MIEGTQNKFLFKTCQKINQWITNEQEPYDIDGEGSSEILRGTYPTYSIHFVYQAIFKPWPESVSSNFHSWIVGHFNDNCRNHITHTLCIFKDFKVSLYLFLVCNLWLKSTSQMSKMTELKVANENDIPLTYRRDFYIWNTKC